MLNRTIFLRLLAFLLFLCTLAVSAVDLSVSVQPRNLTVGMRGYIEISAENVSRLQVNRMPGRVSGIEWSSGISSGSSMSVINGVTSSKYTLRIPFTAREEGDFTIPSFEVIVNGNTRQPESAGPVRIRISAMPKIDPSQVNSNEPVYSRITFPGVAEDRTPTFWVGEEIPLQLSIFVRTPYELRLANYPEIKSVNGKMSIRFHDFRKVNPDAPNFESITSHNQRLGNIPYTVYDFDTKFRALAPGQLQLVADTAAILLDERDFFSAFTSTRQTIRGASPEITIKPLPAAPADAPFVGLIGKWAPEASLSPGPYRIGEPLSLKINFTGEDQTEMLNMPKIEPEHFRAYPPETKETASGISVSCILIPLEQGDQTISFNCSTFDPSTGQYVPFKFRETIKVDKAASGGMAAIPAGAAVVNADPDLTSGAGSTPAPESILYLHDEDDGGRVAIPLAMNALWISLGLILAGSVFAGGSAFAAARKRSLESDPSARRRIDARARRGKLASAIEKTPPQDLPDKVGADLAAFFNDMLDLPPGTSLSETASRVKESEPELGRQLEDLANIAWMPSLRSQLNEKFRKQLASAVRKFGVIAFFLGTLFLALPANAAEEAAAPDKSVPAEIVLPKTSDEAKTAYDAGQFRQRLEDRFTQRFARAALQHGQLFLPARRLSARPGLLRTRTLPSAARFGHLRQSGADAPQTASAAEIPRGIARGLHACGARFPARGRMARGLRLRPHARVGRARNVLPAPLESVAMAVLYRDRGRRDLLRRAHREGVRRRSGARGRRDRPQHPAVQSAVRRIRARGTVPETRHGGLHRGEPHGLGACAAGEQRRRLGARHEPGASLESFARRPGGAHRRRAVSLRGFS